MATSLWLSVMLTAFVVPPKLPLGIDYIQTTILCTLYDSVAWTMISFHRHGGQAFSQESYRSLSQILISIFFELFQKWDMMPGMRRFTKNLLKQQAS
jgi:hypothetical protein